MFSGDTPAAAPKYPAQVSGRFWLLVAVEGRVAIRIEKASTVTDAHGMIAALKILDMVLWMVEIFTAFRN
eukprot:scaffold17320_cov76-Amphora_coffeaeformis.AAC.1